MGIEAEIRKKTWEFEWEVGKWCEGVESFTHYVYPREWWETSEEPIPDLSTVVGKYKEICKLYKGVVLKTRKREEARKAAEKNKPKKRDEFTKEKANAYLNNYRTYFCDLSKIMDAKTLEKFNDIKVKNDMEKLIKNDNLNAKEKIEGFEKDVKDAIELANKFSTDLRNEYLKEKSKGFNLDRLKNIKTVLVNMNNKINEIKKSTEDKKAKLRQLFDLMGKYSKDLKTMSSKLRLCSFGFTFRRLYAWIIADCVFKASRDIRSYKDRLDVKYVKVSPEKKNESSNVKTDKNKKRGKTK